MTVDLRGTHLTSTEHMRRFWRRTTPDKLAIVRLRLKRIWNRLLPGIPLPIRLPYGGWWLARNDFCGDMVAKGGYEDAEFRFVRAVVQPGMTVLDIGAHNGFYTLLASRRVGRSGRVVAFEPSSRERQRLQIHLRLNRCKNVRVESVALADRQGEADFFVVEGRGTGCNSLRLPDSKYLSSKVRVHLATLDDHLSSLGITKVGFIKMDVEGAELSVLKGASTLLAGSDRPVILCEVEDDRTRPWGYESREILRFLSRRNYEWFIPLENGSLSRISVEENEFQGNLIAIPTEHRLAFARMLPGREEGQQRNYSQVH